MRQTESWFYSHYVYAANVITSTLGKFINLKQSCLLDFGCGDGIMALGVQHGGTKEVIGVDLNRAFQALTYKTKRVLKLHKLPKQLKFVQVQSDLPLPFRSGYFDGAYSWSVFEHIQNVPQSLEHIYSVLKPRGYFFLQIEPLFYSPFGSHLQRLVDEPWAHLLLDKEEYIAQARVAEDRVKREEQDMLYKNNEFEDVKDYLIKSYFKLNCITVKQLLIYIQEANFSVVKQKRNRLKDYTIPSQLLERYGGEDLLTNEIQLTLRKES